MVSLWSSLSAGSSSAAAPSSTPSTPPPPTDRNAAADAELAALITDLNTPTSTADTTPHLSGIPENMSCLTAFDELYYCYSLGGQFLNVYRYGGMRDCSGKFKDLKFCMKTKMYGAEEKKEMVKRHYREKEEKVRKGRSSEEVWKMREDSELLHQPFSGDMEDLRRDRLD